MDVASAAGSSETIRTTDGLTITAYGLTDIGCKRSVNQDTLGNRVGQFAAMHDGHGLLYAVADGMGGHAHGEVASAIAIDTIFDRYYAAEATSGVQRALDGAMRASNAAVYAAGRAAGGGTMGTTLTAAVLQGKYLYVGNIGDSRIYLIRDGRIKQLSQDHSLVGEQLRRGLLTEEQARASTIRNVITRAVGHNEEVEPDIFAFTIEAGDRLILCSDGLHGLVENGELARVVGAGPLDEAVRTLIALARERGGPDNITALAVSIDQLGAAAGETNEQGTAPIVIGASDDTPLVLPRVDDIEMLDSPPAAPEERPTVPIPPLTTSVRPAAPIPAPPPAVSATAAAPLAPPHGAVVPPPTAQGRAAAARATPQAQRAPLWLFVVVPLVIVALLIAGGFVFVGARQGDGQSAPAPAGAPGGGNLATAVPTGTTASAATRPAALATAATAPTPSPTAPPPTTTPAAIGGRLPTTANTPIATRESGGIAPAIPPRAITSPSSATGTGEAGQTTIAGTVIVENGVALPEGFPDRWAVMFYDQGEWERDQRTAAPRMTARLERPLGQNTPVGRYTFRLTFTPPATGGNYIVQLRHDEGTSVATTAGGTLSLAVRGGDRLQEFSFRVIGFGGGAEIGR